MFRRFAQILKKTLPLSIGALTHLSLSPVVSLDIQEKHHLSRINIISNVEQYQQKDDAKNRAIILCQLHGDQFIDKQLIKLAEKFILQASDQISVQYEFLFVKGQRPKDQQMQHYFVIYSNEGEKVISLDNFINQNRDRQDLVVNCSYLMQRIVSAINGFRDLRLSNLNKQIQTIQSTQNYHAIVVIPDQKEEQIDQLRKYLRDNDVKDKFCQKYVVRDRQSMQVLGLGHQQPGVYLFSADNNNVLPEVRQSLNTIKIGQKKCFWLPIGTKLSEVFVFPPTQPKNIPQQLVLNMYVNKNFNSLELEQKLTRQLSKPEYRHFQRAKYCSEEVEAAALTLQMNDYSVMALKAFDPKLPLPPQKVKYILGNSHQWNYPVNKTQDIDSERISKWIQQSTGENRFETQTFKSQKGKVQWATPLTGIQYKEKRDQLGDKIIYHYSQHCFGCKKFGGKYEQFAKNRKMFPGLKFYRINNDRNKAQGVRNYNTTPVFAYYKNGCRVPFIYRMPIFTQQLFQSFLRITGQLQLLNFNTFFGQIQKRQKDRQIVKQFINEMK